MPTQENAILLKRICQALAVHFPNKVDILEYVRGPSLILKIVCDRSDAPAIIGREGSNIEALRRIFDTIAYNDMKSIVIDLDSSVKLKSTAIDLRYTSSMKIDQGKKQLLQ